MTRRHLLQSAAGAVGLAAFVAVPTRADAASCVACPRMTVWRLASDWDEPRGPNGKTNLISRASRRAAQNRYTLTESNALDMNLHPGSWAPAVPIEVCAEAFASLWGELSYPWHNPWLAKAVPILDIRTVGSVGNGADRLNHALLLGRAGSEVCAAGVVVSAEPPVTVFADVLPFTGFPVAVGALSAAGMLVTGLVALRISRRVDGPATPASGGEWT